MPQLSDATSATISRCHDGGVELIEDKWLGVGSRLAEKNKGRDDGIWILA